MPDRTDSLHATLDGSGLRLACELAPGLEIVRPLGRGRAGEVFLAREPGLKRLVAVKLLAKERAGDDAARQRFQREATAAAALNHPNTVALHRFGYLSDGAPYLVMQYVPGPTLEERLAAEGPLPVPEARRIIADVCDALAAAHRHGFIHRDVRPANLLCDRESDRVLVADFGVAGLVPDGEASGAALTRVGEILSLLEYTSPEQLEGQAATEAADLYALGVTGYILLTGEGPFPARSPAELADAHLKAAPRPLRSLRPDVDEDLADLLERCLAKNPRKRPEAAHIATALRRGASGDDPGAPRGSDAPAEPRAEAGDLIQDLLRRRLPQVVAVTVVAGYALLSFVDQLADRDVLPEIAYSLALTTYLFGVAVSGVAAWFHGQPGRQGFTPLELLLLAVLYTGWIASILLIVLL